MKWSIQELHKALQMYRSINIRYTLKKTYKRYNIFFYWLIHGYTKLYTFNAGLFLVRVTRDRLKYLNDHIRQLKSYPSNVDSIDRWKVIIVQLYKGFEAIYDYNYNEIEVPDYQIIYEETLELYQKHLLDLWD